MRTIKILFTLVLLGLSYNSFAQCAYGIPNNPGCIPPTHWYPQQGGSDGSSPPPSRGGWYKTWGAIALDPTTGVIGVLNKVITKESAEEYAIKDCIERGGSNSCKIVTTYYDKCVSAASAGDGGLYTATAGKIKQASKKAITACEKDGKPCQIIYAQCAGPIHLDF